MVIIELINAISFVIYQVLFFPVTFFSFLFYSFAAYGILGRKGAKVEGSQEKLSELPKVTIQIPTYNEPVALRCAEKCLEFDYPKDKFEIIIGDDSKDKSISALIDKFVKAHKNVRVTRRGDNTGFKAGNLNYMLKFSRGEIIVIFDSDFIPPRDFLKRIVAPFATDEKIACVQAKWGFLNRDYNFISKFASIILRIHHNLIAPLNNFFGVATLFGSGEAIRKDVLEKYGGWQMGSLTEDVEFSLRILTKKYKIVYLENLSVPGELPYTVQGFVKQQQKWAYGNFRAFADHAKELVFSGNLNVLQKLCIAFTTLGYVASVFIAVFATSIYTHTLTIPWQTFSVANFVYFSNSIVQTLIVVSGFLAAGFVILWQEKRLSQALTTMVVTFTFGVLVTFKIAIAVLKALFNVPMIWHMIQKQGNEQILTEVKPI